MPGAAHETLVALLQQQPALLDALLTILGRPGLPAGAKVMDSALRVAQPLEVRPDLVLTAEGERGPWMLVEVQLDEDPAKQRRWLEAAAVLLDTRGVMGDVVVLTHDASVARWAASIAQVIGPGGTRLALEPVVIQLTRAEVDVLLRGNRPEVAVFAAWAVHDQRDRTAQRVVSEAARVLGEVADAGLREALLRAMLSMLGEPLLALLEEMSMNADAIPETPRARALRLALEARGEARGRAAGEAEALLTVLKARGIDVDDAGRGRITACTDLVVLKSWITRAVTAASLEQVFADAG